MRLSKVVLLATLPFILLLSACGQKAEEAASDAAAATTDAGPEAASASDVAGPDIGRAVTPGVAFAYSYAFTLPAKAISGVQQEHAAACAKLGTSRCRVTGMSYEQPDEDRVSARMDFLLAPDIAHSFGSAGVALVEQAEGKLENASVSGENAGEQIELSQQDSAGIEAEAQRIEARLAAKGLTARERAELQNQLGNLREQLRGNAQTRQSLEKTIATTPVSFAYASQGLIGGSGSFGKAASASWSSLETMLAFLTLIAGIALPWLLLIGLIVVILRSPAMRRLLGKTPPAEPQPPL
jgi:Domain of unknown function (DUF4349)